MIDHTKTSNLTKIYPIKPRYSHLKIKNKTKTVKKRDQLCLNFKFDRGGFRIENWRCTTSEFLQSVKQKFELIIYNKLFILISPKLTVHCAPVHRSNATPALEISFSQSLPPPLKINTKFLKVSIFCVKMRVRGIFRYNSHIIAYFWVRNKKMIQFQPCLQKQIC